MSRVVAIGVALTLGTLLCRCSPASAPPPGAHEPWLSGNPAAGGPPGSRVLVERNNQWLPATIVSHDGARGRVWIHYEGFGAEWDELVTSDRVRPAAAATPTEADYRAGEKVLVDVRGRSFPADVVQQIAPNVWRVHYDGYGPAVAENVGAEAMRRPHAGASAGRVGEAIGVDVGSGRVIAGKVVATVAEDRWIVRFDGLGPEHDEEVGADRIRDAPKVEPAPAPAGAVAAPPTAARAGRDEALQAGDQVLVAHRDTFHAATVTASGPGGLLRVRYQSSPADSAEEELARDRVQRLPAAQKGAPYAPAQKVFIERHGMYMPGTVVKEHVKGRYRVRFEGHGPDKDEIVGRQQVRPRPPE